MPNTAPRIKGFDYLGGYRYSLTICTHGKRAVFLTAHAVNPVLDQILRSAERYLFAVLAYCFMPDHLHLLVEGLSDASDMQQFVKDWKQRSAYQFARAGHGRLWQVGFFDHVLRSDESAYKHALYIIGNPVRAGWPQPSGSIRLRSSGAVP